MIKFDIVILAYLRDRAVQKARKLLPAEALQFTSLSMRVSDVATQITNSGGVRVLFIFYGWDEFPPVLQNKSLVSTIIQEPHKLNLQQSTVIITTRPVASGNLLHIARDRRVEILGFTPKQIHAYIKKALNGNNTHIQKLAQHLEKHPVIEGYCYIPLHAAILVHLFLTMKGVLPVTLYQLFCNLVLCCIVREVETRESHKVLAELSSLDDLPDYLKSQLSDFCVLAHEGVMQNKVVLYNKDLKAFHLPTHLPSLGLLQVVEGLTLTSKSLSYNFLHLSVQELLTAYHISQMNPSKQVKVFKQMFGGSRFQAVLLYYSGFTKLANPAIQELLLNYIQSQTDFKKILPLLYCFFEAQQPSLSQLVGRRFKKIMLDFINPVDYLVVGYFITSLHQSKSSSDLDIQLQLNMNYRFDDHGLKLMMDELLKYSAGNGDCSGSLTIYVVDSHQNPACFQTYHSFFALFLSIFTFAVVSLSISNMLCLQVHQRRMPKSVEGLSIDVSRKLLVKEGKYCDMSAVLMAKTIIALYLEKIQFTSELSIVCEANSFVTADGKGLLHLSDVLQTNSCLTKLQLNNMRLQYKKRSSNLTEMLLVVNKSLRHLDLSGSTIVDSEYHSTF